MPTNKQPTNQKKKNNQPKNIPTNQPTKQFSERWGSGAVSHNNYESNNLPIIIVMIMSPMRDEDRRVQQAVTGRNPPSYECGL